VDVNVHPSKHEVRFHQARWVHDYIVNTLAVTLNNNSNNNDSNSAVQGVEHGYQPPTIHETTANAEHHTTHSHAQTTPSRAQEGYSGNYQATYKPSVLDNQQVNAYCDFVSEAHQPLAGEVGMDKKDYFELISLIKNQYILIKLPVEKELLLVSLAKAYQHLEQSKLMQAWQDGEVISQPLLLPVRIDLHEDALAISERFEGLFIRLGFAFKKQAKKLIVSKVPALLRQAPVAKILPLLFDYLVDTKPEMEDQQVNDFCAFMLNQITTDKLFDISEVQPLLVQFTGQSLLQQNGLYIKPDLSLLLQGFSDE
jgi:DNA mismatch repair protein MutL